MSGPRGALRGGALRGGVPFGETTRDIAEELMDRAGIKGYERETYATRLGMARLWEALELVGVFEEEDESEEVQGER